MAKLINWLSKTLLNVLVVSGLTLYLTWVMVHAYVDNLLKQYHLNRKELNVNLPEFLSQLSNTLNLDQPSTTQKQSAAVDRLDKQVSAKVEKHDNSEDKGTDNGTVIPGQADPHSINSNPSPKKVPDDAIAVMSQKKTNESMVMSSDEFYKKKELLSDSDKMKIFTLLVSRLPESEMQKITNEVEGGITAEEWQDIQQKVSEYLKPEEYQQLMDILNKY